MKMFQFHVTKVQFCAFLCLVLVLSASFSWKEDTGFPPSRCLSSQTEPEYLKDTGAGYIPEVPVMQSHTISLRKLPLAELSNKETAENLFDQAEAKRKNPVYRINLLIRILCCIRLCLFFLASFSFNWLVFGCSFNLRRVLRFLHAGDGGKPLFYHCDVTDRQVPAQ